MSVFRDRASVSLAPCQQQRGEQEQRYVNQKRIILTRFHSAAAMRP